ncbi:MAG: LysR family transcriptional regulator [Undibacterium sp.]|nr:LysR family transcriptional regulator [Opitutaceae bacterium]
MSFLNYHHLRYFRAIAGERTLTKAAAKLNMSAPALSIQLKQLEESLGHALFLRERQGMMLTEAGRLALDYAETIFRAGDELQDVMRNQPRGGRLVLRVGAVSTLSRNFVLGFLRPALHRTDVELVLRSGGLRELLGQAHAHQIDLVLSNQPVRRDAATPWHSHLLAEEPVGLVGGAKWRRKKFSFPADCATVPLVLPSLESATRAAFDRVMDAAGVRPLIAAEVDDMAMLRLLAREEEGLALVPQVVVRDEIAAGVLSVKHRFPQIRETFYAITPNRRFPNPLVKELVAGIAAEPRAAAGGAAAQ